MKQKTKELRVAIILGVLAIAVVLYLEIRGTLAEVYGKEVIAIVVELPESCRSPIMKVQYIDDTYRMRITRKACREGEYHPGNYVTLKYYEPLDKMVWPKEWKPASSMLPLVIIIVIAGMIWLGIRQEKKN
jgi:hypothetical protein